MSPHNVPGAGRAARQGRIVSAVFVGLGLGCAAGGVFWAWIVQAEGDGAFAPYLLALAAAPCLALAASLRVGAAVVRPSGVSPVAEPTDAGFGWSAIAAWRPYCAVRNGALVSAALFLGIGIGVFSGYLALHGDRVSPLAVLVCLVWSALTGRLLWGAVVRTSTASRIGEARLLVKPPRPAPGCTLQVRIEQHPRRAELAVRGLTVSLVCERTWQERRASRLRTFRSQTLVERARLGERTSLTPTRPLVLEHAFVIPAALGENPGFLRFRVDVRTHLRGADYRSRFPLQMPD